MSSDSVMAAKVMRKGMGFFKARMRAEIEEALVLATAREFHAPGADLVKLWGQLDEVVKAGEP